MNTEQNSWLPDVLSLDWKVDEKDAVLSEKDQNAPLFKEKNF